MKLNLAIAILALSLPIATFSQDTITASNSEYPNTFSSGSANISPFTKNSKRFNDWSVSFGVGVPLVQSADLTSIKNGNGSGKNVFGYSAYLSVDKAITHAFGLNLQYDRGETRQGWFNTKTTNPTGNSYQEVGARTQYDGISILGDLNFSNLLRRVDNRSTFRWALHGYFGFGTLAYRAYQEDFTSERLVTENKPFSLSSMFGQAGAGLKFKVNKRIDVESRVMYVVTGDDEFDGGGEQYSSINLREDQVSDNFINATLGVSMKLGKHESHLMWHDPLQEIYYKLDVLANKNPDIEVCKIGDADNDGVCDDWDRQLDTPAGARVDGAGVALDTDLDTVIDLFDKCVTVPGPVENNGCPISQPQIVDNGVSSIDVVNKDFEGIEFELNKDVIRPTSFDRLNHAAEIIKTLDANSRFLVIGCTDTRGSDTYNLKLSDRRARSVVKYLISKGVSTDMLIPEGRGEQDLKYPECNPYTNCDEVKNEANRRVYFKAK